MHNWWEVKRRVLTLSGTDDYSGRDLEDVYLKESSALSHAFLNGTSIISCVFLDSALDQCEFAEAHVERSHFANVDLSGSDFVRALFRDTEFSNCDFTDGEWREARFERVRFIGCK